ncbi:hypothetical protein PAAG_05168 [Paracoccidioides lutzii Pb01]|uniref:Uncharacterized protein n=1 Tax=Paracoccidioides lutzii (strain ATCC MYA-826 / Pb01) TaxID=502779 RepID=C1H325_PARBA|nr:hypothetical protein PAAG_05168 [Paracoccidioides lutzii Pb01]EEH34119.1 hypothetical protein PAAG_05168 [Paracoccidioides lutzii Pb01]
MPPASDTVNHHLISQISTNLSNTLSSFGPSSSQYAAVLDMLREGILRELERERKSESVELSCVRVDSSGSDGENIIEGLRELLEKALRV